MNGLRALRLRRLMTQQELGQRVGVRYQTIGAWEAGTSRPRIAAMRRLCEVLEVTPDELLAALAEQVPAEEGKAAA